MAPAGTDRWRRPSSLRPRAGRGAGARRAERRRRGGSAAGSRHAGSRRRQPGRGKRGVRDAPRRPHLGFSRQRPAAETPDTERRGAAEPPRCRERLFLPQAPSRWPRGGEEAVRGEALRKRAGTGRCSWGWTRGRETSPATPHALPRTLPRTPSSFGEAGMVVVQRGEGTRQSCGGMESPVEPSLRPVHLQMNARGVPGVACLFLLGS